MLRTSTISRVTHTGADMGIITLGAPANPAHFMITPFNNRQQNDAEASVKDFSRKIFSMTGILSPSVRSLILHFRTERGATSSSILKKAKSIIFVRSLITHRGEQRACHPGHVFISLHQTVTAGQGRHPRYKTLDGTLHTFITCASFLHNLSRQND